MSEINTKNVGAFLTALRKAKGMTQQEVAERLCVTNKAISRWECGDGYPEITILPAVAELYGVTVDEILKGARIAPDDAAAQERAQANTQKQVKHFTRKLSDFCLYAAIIAAVITFLGIIIFLTIGFALSGLIGTVFYLIFLLIAASIQIFSILRAKSRLDDNEMLEEFPELAEGVKKKLALYSLRVFSFIAFSLCLTGFLGFSGDGEYLFIMLALWISPWLTARQIAVGILRKNGLLSVNGKTPVGAAFVVLSAIMALAPLVGVITNIIFEQFPDWSYITYVYRGLTVRVDLALPIMLTSFAVSAVSAVALAIIERKKKN